MRLPVARPGRRRELRDATVLVTGAAGGLGRAVVPLLLARGARVALLDLDADTLTAWAAELGTPDRVAGFAADVRSAEGTSAAVDAAADRFGGVDVVVAAAGVDLLRPFAAMTQADFERVVDVNLFGVQRTFRAALPHMAAGGHLLGIASMASFVHSPLHSAYTASKAGLWAMCNSLRLELRPAGITVGTVHPTFFASPMTAVTLAGPTAWHGNTGPFFSPVGVEAVAAAVVRAVERRSAQVTVPRGQRAAALAPGLVRPVLDRVAFRDRDVRRALGRTAD